MDVPSQVLAQFAVISAIVLITASYLYSLSLYESFLKQRELEVAAYKIEYHIIEAINEAIKSKSKIVKNVLIGSNFKGRIIEENNNIKLILSNGNIEKEIDLTMIGLKEHRIKLNNKGSSYFIAYNVTIIVDYKEEEKEIIIQLG
jgi:hypothetical protein